MAQLKSSKFELVKPAPEIFPRIFFEGSIFLPPWKRIDIFCFSEGEICWKIESLGSLTSFSTIYLSMHETGNLVFLLDVNSLVLDNNGDCVNNYLRIYEGKYRRIALFWLHAGKHFLMFFFAPFLLEFVGLLCFRRSRGSRGRKIDSRVLPSGQHNIPDEHHDYAQCQSLLSKNVCSVQVFSQGGLQHDG